MQVGVGRGGVVGGIVVKAAGEGGVVCKVGKCQAEPGFGPTQRSVSQGGNPAGLEVGAGWVEVALARRQTMGRPYLDGTA